MTKINNFTASAGVSAWNDGTEIKGAASFETAPDLCFSIMERYQ